MDHIWDMYHIWDPISYMIYDVSYIIYMGPPNMYLKLIHTHPIQGHYYNYFLFGGIIIITF